jgi:hypothetical protein
MKRARAEVAAFTAQQRSRAEPLENRTLVVAYPDLAGVAIEAISSLVETGVIVPRHPRVGQSEIRAAGRVRCPHDRLRHRLPVDHTAAHPRGRGSF